MQNGTATQGVCEASNSHESLNVSDSVDNSSENKNKPFIKAVKHNPNLRVKDAILDTVYTAADE